jgi:hypothetical protein
MIENMAEDIQTNIVNEFFQGGWRIAPFIKTSDGYIGVKAWPKRAATNVKELQVLLDEQAAKSSKVPILGIVPSRGKYVIDIDTKKNSSALQLWKDKVVEAYGDAKLAMPDLVVKTKSGGYHLYFSDGSDRQLHSPTSVFGKDSGIDIRGYTGMVVAPTSIGTEEDWQLGDYVIVKGRPGIRSPCSDSARSSENRSMRSTASSRPSYTRLTRPFATIVSQKSSGIGSFPIHSSSPRPIATTLSTGARASAAWPAYHRTRALLFMQHLSARCETSDEEPLEHWIKLGADKYDVSTPPRRRCSSRPWPLLRRTRQCRGGPTARRVQSRTTTFRHGSTMLRIELTIEVRRREHAATCYKAYPSIRVRTVKYQSRRSSPATTLGTWRTTRRCIPRATCRSTILRRIGTSIRIHDPFATFEPDLDVL